MLYNFSVFKEKKEILAHTKVIYTISHEPDEDKICGIQIDNVNIYHLNIQTRGPKGNISCT